MNKKRDSVKRLAHYALEILDYPNTDEGRKARQSFLLLCRDGCDPGILGMHLLRLQMMTRADLKDK